MEEVLCQCFLLGVVFVSVFFFGREHFSVPYFEPSIRTSDQTSKFISVITTDHNIVFCCSVQNETKSLIMRLVSATAIVMLDNRQIFDKRVVENQSIYIY